MCRSYKVIRGRSLIAFIPPYYGVRGVGSEVWLFGVFPGSRLLGLGAATPLKKKILQ
jgi:hypothetical protein